MLLAQVYRLSQKDGQKLILPYFSSKNKLFLSFFCKIFFENLSSSRYCNFQFENEIRYSEILYKNREKNSRKRIYKTHCYHLLETSSPIYLCERINRGFYSGRIETPKSLIKRVDGFKLLIQKFASRAARSETFSSYLEGDKQPRRRNPRGKVTRKTEVERCRSAWVEDIDHETFAWKFLAGWQERARR